MLIGPDQAGAFLAAALLITLAPGPDNLMVLSLGMARGRAAGISFGLGCALGCLSHTTLAALGIGALILASGWAFAALRIAGGLYLAWLGVQVLRNARGATACAAVDAPTDLRTLFLRGLIANAINPKVIVFFLAFLPQFVTASRGAVGWQIAQLGILFTMQAVIIFAAIGYFAGRIGTWISRTPALGVWLDRLAGGLFVVLGLRLIAAR